MLHEYRQFHCKKIFLKLNLEKKIFLKLNLEKNNIFKTEPGKRIIFSKLNLKKKIFFIKFFTTSKKFCSIDVYKYGPRIKLNWLRSN